MTILLSWYTNNYIWNALTISHEITIFKYKKSYGENIILYFLEKHIYNNNFLKSYEYIMVLKCFQYKSYSGSEVFFFGPFIIMKFADYADYEDLV